MWSIMIASTKSHLRNVKLENGQINKIKQVKQFQANRNSNYPQFQLKHNEPMSLCFSQGKQIMLVNPHRRSSSTLKFKHTKISMLTQVSLLNLHFLFFYFDLGQ